MSVIYTGDFTDNLHESDLPRISVERVQTLAYMALAALVMFMGAATIIYHYGEKMR